MRRFPALPGVVAALVLVASALPAAAAPARERERERTPSPDDTATEEAAKTRYAEGIRLFKKRKWEEARAAFLQANALKRRPAALLMLAQSSLNSGRYLEALRELDAYSAEAGELTPKVRDLVEAAREDARAHLGHLRFDVPDGAEVTVDGDRVTSLDAPLDVMPGPHTVTVTHRDEKKTQTITASAGAATDIHPSFVPKALVPTSETRTRPTLPPPRTPSDQVAGGSTSILAPPATTWPVYAAGIIGLGGLAAAAVLGGLQANAAHTVEVATQTLVRNGKRATACSSDTGWATANGQDNDAERNKYEETCITLRKNEALAHERESAFGLALIVGLSGTALAAGWFLFAPKETADKPPTEGRPYLIPWASPEAAGATLRGRF